MSRDHYAINATQEFFRTARERYNIHLRRLAGQSPPWTEDLAFREWRFCNVFREDDRTTRWVREHVREPLRDDPRVITALGLCRFTNRIPTLEALLAENLFVNWNPDQARAVLAHCEPVTNAAYVVKTPTGMNKGDGIVAIVEGIHQAHRDIWARAVCLQDTHTLLRELPLIGPFMAYEIVTDLRHTDLLQNAPDILTWASPGPGAIYGLSVFGGQLTGRWAEQLRLVAMQELLLLSRQAQLWPLDWPAWEMREVEHWLCEFAKWCQATHKGASLKRRYQYEQQ